MRPIAAPLRIAHLTATFPPYPRRGGQHRASASPSARPSAATTSRSSPPPHAGEAPDPGGAIVHRIDPVFAIGNAPLIPSLARLDGFDVVHLHYPFIFGSELTLLARLRKRRRASRRCSSTTRTASSARARAAPCSRPTSTPSRPALIRAADRVCVLSADHADSVPYLRRAGSSDPSEADRDAERRRRRAVLARPRHQPACASGSAIPDDAVVAAFVATLDRAHHFKRRRRRDRGARRARRRARAPGRRRRRRAARELPRAGAARPASASASTSSARSPTASCPRCCAPATSSC